MSGLALLGWLAGTKARRRPTSGGTPDVSVLVARDSVPAAVGVATKHERGNLMSRWRHVIGALTILFTSAVGSIMLAGPASATVVFPPEGGGSSSGGSSVATTGGGGLEWWAIMLIVIGAVAVVAAIAEVTRFEIRHHH